MNLTKCLIIAVVGVFFMPVLQAIWLKYYNPCTTVPILLRQIKHKRSGLGSARKEYRWIQISEISPRLLECLWVAEDPEFFKHFGFDFGAIRRAILDSIRTRQRPRGASTITMQCARSVFLWQKRSWLRKGLEAYYTFCIELFLSKRRILEVYANVIELGDGIYGVEAACWHHFGIPASKVNRPQAVTLVWLLPSPRMRCPQMLDSQHPRYLRIYSLSERARLPWLPS